MPRIFDNLAPDSSLLPALQETLGLSSRADFCVGYFNLRGWSGLAPLVDSWQPEDGPCRVLIGMQRLPHDDLRQTLSLVDRPSSIDNQTAHRLKVQLAEQLRQQLSIGAPTNADERTLRQLAAQLRTKKVVVKLFLRHPLHAKLYLLFRNDPINPIVGYLGSSNLTFAGLSAQGELNVDVLDHDVTLKLKKWFEDRWNDRFCVDITDELLQIIEDSWAREALMPPYHVYLKMAYHLSHEARAGLAEFRIPKVFGDRLFDFQAAAVKIAAHHLNKRNGVLIGDVVGLGKTLMATAVARIFEDDYGLETLIICPRNLVPMWEDYVYQYQLRARVLSLSRVLGELPTLRRYRLVVIDESHNLRNREGRRYRAIQEYVRANESKCILLSATPYNKTYLDLSSQLRIFVEEDQDLGIRPERLLRQLGEIEFSRRHQAAPRTLAAFDFSEYADDWRDLMRLYLVRRTRSFIQDNYAEMDQETGRKFLTYEDGTRSFFPTRVPKTVKFAIDDSNPNDQYAKLYSPKVVDIVKDLHLPRYGIGNYLLDNPETPPSKEEERQIDDLSRAGKRLIGFCRTNLFKRLESSGAAFLQSVERHVLRNYVFLHAIRNGSPLPLGTQDAEMLDSRFTDKDADQAKGALFDPDDDEQEESQNLQDSHVVVNYDLPWAIIRLIQRAGRVDRIGQKAEEILCHSFLPADGVERIIDLRGRVRTRLRQNAEVVGADEAFFEDEDDDQAIVNLYHERAGILDGDPEGDVDLASHAYQIWKNAIGADPSLEKSVAALPDVVFSSRQHAPIAQRPEGVLVFMRTADGNDALAYVDREGRCITESQLEILSAAECRPDTPAQPHDEDHHRLVAEGVKHVVREEKRVGGQLGRPSGARFRTYTRLKAYADGIKGQLFDVEALHKAIDDIYRYPLRPSALDTLNRQLRSGVSDDQLAKIVMSLREEDRLCLTGDDASEAQEPQIICSLGLFDTEGAT